MKTPQDVFLLVSDDPIEARAQAIRWANELKGKKFFIVAPTAEVQEFLNAAPALRGFTVVLRPNTALELVRRRDRQKNAQARFVINEGAAPEEFFDLENATEEERRLIVVNILLKQLGFAVELSGSRLLDWQAFRQAQTNA